MSLLPRPLGAGMMTPIGAPANPPAPAPQQGGFMGHFGGLLNDPLFNFGIGLLSGGAPGGTFAGGMQAGLRNAQAAQQQQQQMALLTQRMAALKAQEQADKFAFEQQQRQQQARDALYNRMVSPQPYAQPAGQTFPGEAPIAGLQQAPTEAQLAEADLFRAAPDQYLERLMEPPTPAKAPTIKEFKEGNRIVTKQFNPITGQWDPVSQAGRWDPQRGMSFSVGPDGEVQFTQGMGALGTAQSNRMQEGQWNSMQELADLNQIRSMYRPEFQEFGTRMDIAGTDLQSRMGMDIDPEDEQTADEFYQYKTTATNMLNTKINAFAGSAATDSEIKRVLGGMPNVGTGPLDGDSPLQFESKMKARTRDVRNIIIRRELAERHGLDWREIPLTNAGIDKLLQKEGERLMQQYMDQGMSEPEAYERAAQFLQQQFGITSDGQ